MELNITQFFNQAAPMDYSASIAEIGQNAGTDTWNAACEDSEDYPLLVTADQLDAFQEFVSDSGGWTDEEIAEWSTRELNALCIQWISGDMREAGLDADSTDEDWKEYEANDSLCHRLFKGIDGQIYFYIGS